MNFDKKEKDEKDSQKLKPKVGPLKNPQTNELTSDSQEMANILQKQYCSVFTT